MPVTADAPTIQRRVWLLSLGTLVSRLLGMARETLLAATFDGPSTDAYFIAWRVPNALRALLAEGALSAAFVPVFSATLVKGREAFTAEGPARGNATAALPEGDRVALAEAHRDALREAVAYVRGASLLVLLPLSALGVLFARPILRVLAGDFGGDQARFELSASLLAWLFPYIFFMGSAAVGIGVLQALGRFGALAFAPALLNVAYLLAPFLFVPWCLRAGLPAIHGMALGALLGGVLQLLALVPSLRRAGMLPRPRLDLRHPAVRRVARLLAPVTVGLAIYQVDVMLSNRFLAGLPTNSASYFSYAQRLADIPQGLFVVSIASSFLPELSRAVATGDRDQGSHLLGRMLRLSAFVAVPVAVLLATYGEAVVPVVYGYGRFHAQGPAGVLEVARSLRWQAANVALLAFVRQLTAAYAAAEDTRTPVLVSAVDLGVFVLLALWLRGPLGHVGVAAALTGSTLVQLALLAWRPAVKVPWGSVLPMVAKVLLASAVVGLAARGLVSVGGFHRLTLGARLGALGGGVVLAGVYLLAAWVLRIEELRTAVDRRLRRRRSTA
ncbi:MAG: murein biosynthesis integral membrane protein MurJ [Deltaproteobacteria bacterium]|nr:murein biosynthesis integral membrane protein MurJ [Deltaproteobacteria bacterium]